MSCFEQSSSSFLFFNQPDLGLFLFDIGSDIYNGNSFIKDGNPIWGTVILGVMFLPMTVFYVGYAIDFCQDEDSSRREKLLILLLAPILAVPGIPALTVWYIGYVAYILARRCVQPSYDKEEHMAENLRLVEAAAEANLQAVLG